jgi:YVTN family beta-propeller protein
VRADSDPQTCNLNAVIQNISLGDAFAGPYGLAYDPSNEKMFVTDLNSSSISVINIANNTLSATIPSIPFPSGIVYDPSNQEIYAASSGEIYAINAITNQVVTTISAPSAHALAYDSTNQEIYVGTTSDTMYVISGTTIVATITGLSEDPRTVAYDPLNDRVYVGVFDTEVVDVIDPSTNSIVQSINNVADPYLLLFDSINGAIYDSSSNGLVSVISGSTNTLVTNITLSGAPLGTTVSGMTLDTLTGNIYIGNEGGQNTVGVINGSSNQLLGSISGVAPPGDGPALAYVSANQDIYVANYYRGTIGIITTTGCNVTFAENGLPSGTSWTLTFGSSTRTMTNSTTHFVVSEGTTNWTVSSPLLSNSSSRYAAFPASGTLQLNSSFAETVKFDLQFQVTFSSATSQGTISPRGALWENASSTVAISASSNTGYVFSSWTSSSPSITIADPSKSSTTATVNGPGNISAKFLASSTTGAATVTTSTVSTAVGSSSFEGTFLGNPLFLVAIVVVVVVAALAFFFMRRRKKPAAVVVGPAS